MSIGNWIVFGMLGLTVIGTAVGLLLSRNAIYAALFLALNFVTVGLLYLILGAPFIALSQVTVYAGSIMVLFLFVIMLLGVENLPLKENIKGQRLFALGIGLIFLAELAVFLIFRSQIGGDIPQVSLDFASPAAIGDLLFNKYLLPFEITGFILLSAVIGAIVLTRPEARVRSHQVRPPAPDQK